MKKNTFRAATTGLAAGMMLGSAAFISACNCGYSVYGPPPGWESSFDPSTEEPVDVYGPPVDESPYDPTENIPEAVYGPPEDFTDVPVVPEAPEETAPVESPEGSTD